MNGKGNNAGVFITLEGPDGSGKSTQARLLTDWLRRQGLEVKHTREPGGTPTGDRIRELVLDPSARVGSLTEILLMAASRAQHVEDVIIPALQEGVWVVCERFVDSSLVYQGYGLGEDLHAIAEVNRIATRGLNPNLTIVFDVDPAQGLRQVAERERACSAGKAWQDRIERRGLDFQGRVRAGYQELAWQNPERVVIIDVTGHGIEEVHQQVVSLLRERLWVGGIEPGRD